MFESMKKILHFVTIQMKAAEQIFPVVVVIMLYLQGVEKNQVQCNHSSESCRADFSCCADDNVQTFGSVDEILERVSIQMKAMQYFPVVWFIIFYMIVQVTVP